MRRSPRVSTPPSEGDAFFGNRLLLLAKQSRNAHWWLAAVRPSISRPRARAEQSSHHHRNRQLATLLLPRPLSRRTSICCSYGVASARRGPGQAQLRDLLPAGEQVPLRRRLRAGHAGAGGCGAGPGPRGGQGQGACAGDRRVWAGPRRRAPCGGRAREAGGGAAGARGGPRRARGRLLRRRGGGRRRGRAGRDAAPEGRRRAGAVHGGGCAGVRGGQPREARRVGHRRRRRGRRHQSPEQVGRAVPPRGEVEVLAAAPGVRGRHAQGHRGAAAGPLLRPRHGRAIPLLPRRRRRERQLRLPPPRRVRRHLRRRGRRGRRAVRGRAHGHRRRVRGRRRHGQPHRGRHHARAPQQARVPARRRRRRPPRRLHRLRILRRHCRRRFRHTFRRLADAHPAALAVARRDGPPHRRGRRRHGRPSSGHGVRAHVRAQLRSHPGGVAGGVLREGAEVAGREEGGGGGGRHADAAERGGGAVPGPSAVGEVEPGEAGRVRGGAGEGAGAACAQPRTAHRGDQAGAHGSHAAAVVRHHRLLRHRHRPDRLHHAVPGVAGLLPALATRRPL